jgi:hypothetical protein
VDIVMRLFQYLHGTRDNFNFTVVDELIVDICDLVAEKASWIAICARIGNNVDDGAAYIILDYLDSKGLIHQKASSQDTWITDRGEWVRKTYRQACYLRDNGVK